MSFAESFNEITNIRRNGLDLFDIANEVISLESIKDNKTEYNKKIIEFGFENVNVAYEEVITTVLDAIRRFFEKLWVAMKSFFSKVVAQQKLYIATMNKKYAAIEKLFKVKSTINVLDAKIEECLHFNSINELLPKYTTVCKEVFKKVVGFRLYGFLDKIITGISNDEFDNGIDIHKTLNMDVDTLTKLGFSVEAREVTTGEFTLSRQEMSFDKSNVEANYTSDTNINLLEHNKTISELGYEPKSIKSMIDNCITASEVIIKNHTLVINDIQKVFQKVTVVSKNGGKFIDNDSNDSTVAEKCNKAVGICNTFTSMIQAVVLASGFYNTTVQTTIDRIYDAIKAHVEANLANRP